MLLSLQPELLKELTIIIVPVAKLQKGEKKKS